jgi:hypothetical protein
MYWSASAGLMVCEEEPEETASQQRYREGLDDPVDQQCERSAGLRPTLRTEEKSTFIIIGVIMSQISTAIGTLI